MKSIKVNFLYNTVYQILVVLLPLITSPYISRVLGAQGLGIYSYYNSLASYFLIFAMLGISNYGNRGVASCKNNQKELDTFFSEVFTIQILTTLIACIAYLTYIIFICKENKIIALIMFLYLISGFLDISWLFFGLEEFKITVIRNIIIKLATVVCIFVFVKKTDDVIKYSIIMCMGVFLSQAYLWKYAGTFVKYVFPCFKKLKIHIKQIFLLFIPVLSYSIYKIMDKIMLGSMTAYIQVGYYSNAEKATNIPIGIITAFGTVMLPRMSHLTANNCEEKARYYIDISIKFISFLGCAISFGLIGISEVFTPVFFGEGYDECKLLIKLLSVSILFTSWTTVVRTQFLIPQKKDSIYVSSTLVGAGLNLIINFLLIPKYGTTGAAIGTITAEFALLFVQIVSIRNEINFVIKIIKEWHYVLNGVIMSFFVAFLGSYLGGSIITLVIQIISGVFIYLFLSFLSQLCRHDTLLNILRDNIRKCRNQIFK